MVTPKVDKIFDENSNGDLEFDLRFVVPGHLKVNVIFLNGNLYFRPQILKERKLLCSDIIFDENSNDDLDFDLGRVKFHIWKPLFLASE